MTHRFVPVLLAILLVFAPPSARAEEYFTAIDDLPVAPGMSEEAGASVVFDSPAGRIVTVVAIGAARPDDLRAYYRSALPALGWELQPGAADIYVRDGATLGFSYSRDGSRLTMRIRLATSGTGN